MKVSELVEFLLKQDQDKEVTVWDSEWGQSNPIDYIKVDEEWNEVVIF